MIKLNDTSVRLCCGKKRCPEIKKDGKNFVITDDYKGSVKLTKEEFQMLREAVEFLEDK